MSDVDARLVWTGRGLEFECSAGESPSVLLDGDGRTGPSPVQALLLALATCMAADIVEILGKMRLPLSGLRLRAQGDRAPRPPRRYTRLIMVFEVEGLDERNRGQLERAIALSRETYCSVLHTLRPDIELLVEGRLA